jgi:hypothetical protein
MAILRESPYIWVTWLTKLLVGENSCEWAAWFKAHYTEYTKIPNTFDQTYWQLQHTTLLNELRTRFEKEGKIVLSENQNSFTLRGSTAALGGRPDLIAKSGNVGVICDVKTGKPSPSHSVQVMVYMYGVPRVLRQYQGVSFDGLVVYKDHEVSIPSSAIDETFIKNLAQLIRRVSAREPARKASSPMECGFCDVGHAACLERASEDKIQEASTGDF